MKIGIIQQHNTADRTDNMQRLADGVRASAKGGAELVVLQELHNSLYFCQTENVDNFNLAEPVPGPSTEFFGALAKVQWDKGHVVMDIITGRLKARGRSRLEFATNALFTSYISTGDCESCAARINL